MRIRVALASTLAGALLLAGCADYPRDIEGTSDAIAARGTIRVGLVAGPGMPAPQVRPFLAELARRSRARPVFTTGSAEPLLVALDAGRLDLVIGELSGKTPWLTEAAVIDPPLATRGTGDDEVTLSAIARNGENRWVITLEKTIRDLGDKPA